MRALAHAVELQEEVVDRLGKVVDFVLEFFHVALSLVVLARFLLVALVEILVELFVSLNDLLFDILHDIIHVLSFADLTENVFLELQHGLLDDTVVEVHRVS